MILLLFVMQAGASLQVLCNPVQSVWTEGAKWNTLSCILSEQLQLYGMTMPLCPGHNGFCALSRLPGLFFLAPYVAAKLARQAAVHQLQSAGTVCG